MARSRITRRPLLDMWLRAMRSGRPLPLPPLFDRLAEQSAGLAPRLKAALALLAVAAAVGIGEVRVHVAEQRWGGTPAPVLVAVEDLAVGASPLVEQVLVPPALLPPGAVTDVAGEARLAVALPAGAVLTRTHLDPRGPAVALPADARVVPLPVETGWGVTAGGWVDVWVLGGANDRAEVVARSRPVLAVDSDDAGRATALIGIADDDVAQTTTALSHGRVLLTHAPPPPPAAQ